MTESTEPPKWAWGFEPSHEGLIRAIEQMGCGLLVETADGQVIYANARILEWTGRRADELDRQPTRLIVPPEIHAKLDKEREQAVGGDRRARLSAVQRKDGRTFPVVVVPREVTLRTGEPAILCILVDLGEVYTARPMGTEDGSLADELASMALRLQSLSFSAAVAREGAFPIDQALLQELSTREREVLELLVQGSRVPAIAEKLFISQNTVRNHLKAMFRKVGVSSQSELIERVRSLGA